MKNPITEEKPTKDFSRVERGSGWLSERDDPNEIRISYRNYGVPSFSYNDIGFRIVRNK